jgi:hypothetical protein
MVRDEMVWEGSPMAVLVRELVAEVKPPRLDERALAQRFDALKAALTEQEVRRQHFMLAAQWAAVLAVLAFGLLSL